MIVDIVRMIRVNKITPFNESLQPFLCRINRDHLGFDHNIRHNKREPSPSIMVLYSHAIFDGCE